MRLLALTLLTFTIAANKNQNNQGSISDSALKKAESVTVMITATMDGETRPGAGFIFGATNNQIYIATANHLVRRRTSEAADISVEFNWLPGQPIPAQLLRSYDTDLDLAVVVVDGLKVPGNAAEIPALRFGDTERLKNDMPLWAIGYPDGAAYHTISGNLKKVETFVLDFAAPAGTPGGYSGGPLVDEYGMIVGMIRQVTQGYTQATRIDLLRSRLDDWRYQVGFGTVAEASAPFRNILLRYIKEAPLGFAGLGGGHLRWRPSIALPGADCYGYSVGYSIPESHIQCIFPPSRNHDLGERNFEKTVAEVQGILPSWHQRKADLDPPEHGRRFEPNSRGSAVWVDVRLAEAGTAHTVTVVVGLTNPASGTLDSPEGTGRIGIDSKRPAVEPTKRVSNPAQPQISPDSGSGALPTRPLIVEAGGFSFSLISCKRSGDGLFCNLQITNRRADRRFMINADYGGDRSRVIDKSGREFLAGEVHIGANSFGGHADSRLVTGVAVASTITFSRVPADLNAIILLELHCYAEGIVEENGYFRVQFRNISVTSQE